MDQEIEKTNRLNALFEFYATLLTEKQMNYLELYYADDYSLGEIAEMYGVSRQAVYDNIKRSSKLLENYEKKLSLYSNYLVRDEIFQELKNYATKNYPNDEMLQLFVDRLEDLEEE
ncbi:putative DNA-binding protein [Enterococcus timonensis]|uniref:putative DNA-binding protein n=1 Tax=Enterococcus timonensis TaxID=1852364 RepID=UPI0008DA59DB|nr:putative DNA-binding protein [Enterococcus timonensis]